MITTHYANIKTRATDMPEAVNGSMLFDGDPVPHLSAGFGTARQLLHV